MKPILFNTDMVRAFLDDRKTVTRRVVEPLGVKEALAMRLEALAASGCCRWSFWSRSKHGLCPIRTQEKD